MVTVRFHWNCNFVGCDGYEDVEYTDEEFEKENLDLTSEELVMENIAPEGYYEILDE